MIMVNISAFRGIRYNSNHPKLQDQDDVDLSSLVAKPYDKISRELQETYYEQSPYHFVRLILNNPDFEPDSEEELDRYQKARQLLKEWREEEILIQDEDPSIYVYQTTFVDPSGRERTRTGFFAMGELEPYESGEIIPHEETLSEPKQDRLQLLQSTKANLEPIYMLYPEYSRRGKRALKETIEQEPLYQVRLDGEQNIGKEYHRVWRVQKRSRIRVLQRMLDHQSAVIADGHHRYETALQFLEEVKEKASTLRGEDRERYEQLQEALSKRLMVFVCMEDPGLFIFPSHRALKTSISPSYDTLVQNLEEDFYVRTYRYREDAESMRERQKREFLEDLTFEGLDATTFGISAADQNEYLLLILKDEDHLKQVATSEHSETWNRLDVNILQKLILQKQLDITLEDIRERNVLSYHRHPEKLFELLETGERKIGFFMNPTDIEEVKETARNRELMPQKSTDFYPKLLSGLVFSSLEVQ